MLLKDLLLCIPSGSICIIKLAGCAFGMACIVGIKEYRELLNDWMDKEVGRVSATYTNNFEIILVNDEVKYEI